MGLLGRRKGLVTGRGLLSQVRIGGPVSIEMQPEVPVLRVADFEVCVGNQVDACDGAVKGGSPGVEATVPAGPQACRADRRPIGIEGDRRLQLSPQLAKTPQRVGVVLFEISKAGPPGARRELDVRLEVAHLEVAVERDVGQARRPCRVVVPEADRLKPVPHPADPGVDVLLPRVDDDLRPVLLLQARIGEAVVVRVDRPVRPVRHLRAGGTRDVVGPRA